MNLPFRLPIRKEAATKKKDELAEAALLEQKLEQYQDTLEDYKKGILEYSGKLDRYEDRFMDNQLANVQSALDMTYLKEQEDKAAELLYDMNKSLNDIKTEAINKTLTSMESLSALIVDTNFKLDGVDKNVVNRLSEFLLELQKQTLYQNKQFQSEEIIAIDKLSRSVKKGKTLLWVLFAFNLLGLSALLFWVLYIMEIIPF